MKKELKLIRDEMSYEVKNTGFQEIYEISNQIWDKVETQVRDQVNSQVDNQVRNKIENWVTDQVGIRTE